MYLSDVLATSGVECSSANGKRVSWSVPACGLRIHEWRRMACFPLLSRLYLYCLFFFTLSSTTRGLNR